MILIVDASVAVKLLVEEPDWELAVDIVAKTEAPIAPEWIKAEVGNALAKKVRFTGYPAAAAVEALRALPEFIAEFVSHETLVEPALALSVSISHPFYDCLYLALAVQRKGQVITNDANFITAAARAGFGDHVTALRST